MRLPRFYALAAMADVLLAAASAHAAAAATFAFHLDDTSLQGEMRGHDAGDLVRLNRLASQLRDGLAKSGRYTPVAVPANAGEQSWWTCDGCEVDRAGKAGAKLSVIGWVQEVSNLILNINIVMRDVGTGQRIAAGSVDIRGDTDESWTHGLSFLFRNLVLGGENVR